MAPGSAHKLKVKSNANKTKQILIDRNSKPADSITHRGIKGRFNKENVASNGGKSNTEKEPFVILKAHNNSSKGSEHATKNQTSEINLTPQISIVSAIQRLEIPLTQSTRIPTIENHETLTIESPEILSNEQAPSTETSIETTSSKKRSRGPIMDKGIMKSSVASGSNLMINVDPFIGRPINGDESTKLASQIGVVTRDVLQVPKRWKDVDKEKSLEPCFDHINIHMDVNVDAPGVKQCLIDRLKSSSRQKHYKLHMQYKKFATLVEAKNNKPSFCPCKKIGKHCATIL